MDTPRIAEWNMWYHILNCGFPLKVSGETDFPCMSGERVGQGRVYVQLGKQKRLDFAAWCDGLARGRSYVSDGFAHALAFKVNGIAPGFGDVRLDAPGEVSIEAQVAFAPETPALVAHGFALPPDGQRWSGDTVTLHGPRTDAMNRRRRAPGGNRRQRPARRVRARACRREDSRAAIPRADRPQQLGRAASVPATAHEPGERPRRRRAHPRLAPQRPLVH